MNLIDEIISGLLVLGPEDMEVVKRYLHWMMLRRQVNNRFYLTPHWVKKPPARYHWINK